jgi:DNA replication protein DnaC
VPIDDPRFGTIVQCSCKEREFVERRARKLVERSNLAALADKTFDSCFHPDNKPSVAFVQAQQYARNPNNRWFVLLGDTGTGKTHLAAAIGNYRLALGEPVLFMVVPDLLDHLRASYAPGSELRYDELFEAVRDAPLLILDDLGTQQGSPWASEKLFQLFNHRYIFKLATVVTSTLTLDEIGGRLASRMSEPSQCTVVATESFDFRGGKDVATPQSGESRTARSRLRRVEDTDRP